MEYLSALIIFILYYESLSSQILFEEILCDYCLQSCA